MNRSTLSSSIAVLSAGLLVAGCGSSSTGKATAAQTSAASGPAGSAAAGTSVASTGANSSATGATSAAATSAAASSAGGATSAAPAPSSAAVDTSVSGTITWWDTSDATNEAPAYKTLITAFEAKYPKVEVTYVNVPFSTAESKFKTAAQAGNGAPDVLRSDVGWTPTLASLGYLQALDGTPALANDKDYLPGPYATDHFNGKVYGVPQVTDTLALLYNKSLLAKAGVTSAPTTWAETKTDAAAVESKVPGTEGIFVNADSYFLLPFVYGEGGDYVDAAAKKLTIKSPQVSAAVADAQSLVAKGVGKTDTSSNGYTNMQNDFKSGKAAMVINGPWSTADDLTGAAFKDPTNLGIATVPAGPRGQGGPTGGQNLVVYAGSKNLAADYVFLAFLNSASSQAFVAGKNNVLPTRSSAYADPQVTRSAVLSAFKAPLTVSKARPAAPGAGDIFGSITTDYQKILSGQTSVSSGLADAQKQAAQFMPDFSAK